MSMSPEQEALISRVFETYLTEHHHGDIIQLSADTDGDGETHRPVVVNAMTLFEANMEVGDFFNAFPRDVLAVFDKVLRRKAAELSEDDGGQKWTERTGSRTLHARITGLPVCPELTRDTIPRSRDVGHFLSVTGTVIRTSVAKVLEYERDYMCTKCRHVFSVQADFDQFSSLVPPPSCPNPAACNSFRFSCLSAGGEPAACRDYQEIKIQEQVQRLSVGSVPRSLVVVLEDDLVDGCKSGDDVTVYGVMCLRWKPMYDGARCDVELVLRANNIEVNNQQVADALLVKDAQKEFEEFWRSYIHDPIAGRNHILSSLCPQVFGMYVIKLAVAMVLAGGVQRTDSSGTKIRGECHMLLVGDPGTGKSQFLKYAAKIMTRSVLTAGIGSTSAGLTVAAVKDGGDWHLEAGALVLSDGGLCCIDEFNSIKEHDRISIHEAMEQQSISVAKAGIVCKLNTRTTILAATNPKGQYDPNEPLSVNVALASPLLSRFDLVLVLLDTRNPEWDRIISSFILEDRGLPAESSSLWPMDKMKAYFSVIRRLQPQLSEEADCILTRYYQLQRQSDGRNAARTTIRMLESLSRLAEAHARLMYRETVTTEDAVVAVSVMECSMQGGALLGNVNALLTSFPDDPHQQYQTQCQTLLQGLNLPHLLQREMDRLDRLKSRSSIFNPPTDHSDTHSISQSQGRNVSQSQGRDISQSQGRDIRRSLRSDITVGSGSIFPSLSPEEMAPPIITSTQQNLNRNPTSSWSDVSTGSEQSGCPTEEDVLSTTGSTLRRCVDPDPPETIRKHVNQEEILQSERRRGGTGPESSGGPIQKNLRHRRLRQPSQQSEQDGGGHGDRVASADKHCPSYVRDEDRRSSDPERRREEDDGRDGTVSRIMSSVLKEKMAAGRHTDLNAHLSGFMFRPRRMRLNTQEDPVRPIPNQNQLHSPSAGDGPEPDHEVFSSREDKETGGGSTEDQQRASINTDDTPEPPAEPPAEPGPIRSPAAFRSTVASSTLAKLSRFSFTCTAESTKAEPSPEWRHLRDRMADSPLRTRSKPPPASEPTVGQRPELGTESPAVSRGGTDTEKTDAGFIHQHGSVGLRKRKCFELGPLSGTDSISTALSSGRSLFASTELSNDVLDTDWDQEVSKRPRV
ncbi:DNA helicase MCM9 [Brachyistius frenatus]|uniref:DNA helicase MCM9 n=1 Tax=Brachyistius frenatus TaxID=100188 RepID=UPI0037E7F431